MSNTSALRTAPIRVRHGFSTLIDLLIISLILTVLKRVHGRLLTIPASVPVPLICNLTTLGGLIPRFTLKSPLSMQFYLTEIRPPMRSLVASTH